MESEEKHPSSTT